MKKIATMFLLPFMLFSGCNLLENSDPFASEKATQIGESLLPQDILVLVKIETTNDDEYNNYQRLKETFLFDQSAVIKDFMTELEIELKPYELNYENDIKPLLGDRIETIIALAGDLANNSPDIYIVQKLENLEKYTEITDKIISKQAITAIENGYQANEDAYFGQKNGYFILTNDRDNFVNAMNLNTTESLVYSENYVKVRENLPGTFLGLTYINTDLFIQEIKRVIETNKTNIDQSLYTTLDNPLSNLIMSLGASLNLEENGVKFMGYAQGNQKVIDETEFKFNDAPNQNVYLDKILPGKGLYLYLEGFNLKQKITQFKKNLESNNPEALNVYTEQISQLKTLIGLDLEKDVLTWLDKSIAISIQETQSFIPGISLAVDVSSNPDGAEKLVDTLDSFISIALLSLQEYAEAIQKEEVQIGNSKFTKITILPENLPLKIQEQGDFIVPIFANLTLSYGITNNNTMIFTTYSNFSEDFKKDTIAENVNYKQISQKINKKGQGLLYFSPEIFMNHFRTIAEISQNFKSISDSDQETIEVLSKFFKHLTGLVFTNLAHEDSYEAQGYLKIK